jgi:hypothetical protein
MKTPNCLASACRHCRFYQPEGRRGGHCSQLDAPVRGNWKACSLAIPPFAPSWEALEGLRLWQEEMLIGPHMIPFETTLVNDSQEDAEMHEVAVESGRKASALIA